MSIKKLIIVIVLVVLAGFIVWLLLQSLGGKRLDLTQNSSQVREEEIKVMAQDLQIPWEILFLPDDRMITTERIGYVTIIHNGTKKRLPLQDVLSYGEGGLLGAAFHPDFEENKFIYLYLTYNSGGIKNRVERYIFENDTLSSREVVFDNIPGAGNHDGGRIAFGPDRNLYITTGDAGNSLLSQDKNSLAGKILRITDDGSIPSDNPFGNAVYSYGHRNAQGLAFDDKGNLWATEHGRSGALSGYDELNFIEKGKNYGWPDIQGDESKEGMERPVIHSGPTKTWAPAGIVFYQGSLFWTGLRGQAIYEARVKGRTVSDFKEHFHTSFGRIRPIAVKDNQFYIGTSNNDGRGTIENGDDRIIRLDPDIFK